MMRSASPCLSWSMRFARALSAVLAIGVVTAGMRSVWLQKRKQTEQLTADVQSLAGGLAQVASEGDMTIWPGRWQRWPASRATGAALSG